MAGDLSGLSLDLGLSAIDDQRVELINDALTDIIEPQPNQISTSLIQWSNKPAGQ